MKPRRDFLKTLAAGAATVAVSAPASAQTPPPMTQKSDGQNYAPKGKPNPVVKAGEFVFAAAHLDHGHINGQCNGLIEAGGTLKWVFEPDPVKLAAFLKAYPGTQTATSLEQI